MAAGTRPNAATSATAANAPSSPSSTWLKVPSTGRNRPTATKEAITSRVTRSLYSTITYT